MKFLIAGRIEAVIYHRRTQRIHPCHVRCRTFDVGYSEIHISRQPRRISKAWPRRRPEKQRAAGQQSLRLSSFDPMTLHFPKFSETCYTGARRKGPHVRKVGIMATPKDQPKSPTSAYIRCPDCTYEISCEHAIRISLKLIQCPECKLIFDRNRPRQFPPYRE
jgi:hypothetical protein